MRELTKVESDAILERIRQEMDTVVIYGEPSPSGVVRIDTGTDHVWLEVPGIAGETETKDILDSII